MAKPPPQPQISSYGDSAVYLSFSIGGYDAAVNAVVLDLSRQLRASGKWEDVVCGYDSLIASFNPLKMSYDKARKRLESTLKAKPNAQPAAKPKIIVVPVYYGGENGPDMAALMASNNLSEAAVIGLHSENPYRVCMMGFIPGFTFLSQTPKALHHRRHNEPRLSVPAGSIGIAGWQTGIYGLSSPGGWQIIGRTPLTIFDAGRTAPFLWQAGDSLRFVPQSGLFPKAASS